MKQLLLPALLLFLLLGCSKNLPKTAVEPAKIIFDTDFGPDYDDVGALALLHAMADSGKIEILATISSNKHELVAPGMDVLNTYFGRPNLPVGAPKGNAVNLGAWQHWLDSLVAKFPHKIQNTSEVENAVSVYRRILADQPDSSVTIVTVGFLTNLADLLQSAADSISNLSGKELILKKVKKLVSMSGTFPEGREFNVHMDSTASKVAFENWPTQITFTGYEIGSKIFTGLRVMKMPDNNPVKDVFRISIPMAEEDKNGRMSWDETAVLIGVYGTQDFFDTIRGKMVVNENGSNSWINDSLGNHMYVVQKMPIPEITTIIENRMMHIPKK